MHHLSLAKTFFNKQPLRRTYYKHGRPGARLWRHNKEFRWYHLCFQGREFIVIWGEMADHYNSVTILTGRVGSGQDTEERHKLVLAS